MTTPLWCLLIVSVIPYVLAGVSVYFKQQQFGDANALGANVRVGSERYRVVVHPQGLNYLVEVNGVHCHDHADRMDLAYIPTIGHALALAGLTRDPSRVGGLIESAHAIGLGDQIGGIKGGAVGVDVFLEPGEQRSAREVARQAGIPEAYASKLLGSLTGARLVRSQRGPGGGVMLARPASRIALIDVAAAVGEEGRLAACILGFPECSSDAP